MLATSNNTSFGKSAAYNPALFADDVMDFYMQYTAAKRNMANSKKNQVQQGTKNQLPKVAGAFDYMVSKAEPIVEKVINNPKLLAKPVGMLAAGTALSMYGPEYLCGPTEEEKAQGKRYNLRRSLDATSGLIAADILANETSFGVKALANGNSGIQRVTGAASLLPAIGGVGVVAYRKGTGKKTTLKHFTSGVQTGFLGSVAASSIAMGYTLGNLAAEAAAAKDAAEGGI